MLTNVSDSSRFLGQQSFYVIHTTNTIILIQIIGTISYVTDEVKKKNKNQTVKEND